MAFGPNDPVIKRGPTAVGPKPTTATFGANDPVVVRAPAAKKTSDALGFMQATVNALGKAPPNPLDLILDGGRSEADKDRRAKVDGRLDKWGETAKPGFLGKLAGNVAVGLPLAAITKNPMALGGMEGMLTSEADDLAGTAVDGLMGAGLGHIGGRVADAVGGVLSPVVDDSVKRLAKAGVRLTPGQIKGGKAMVREDKAMSRPNVGPAIAADRAKGIEDFNRGGVNRALFPLGARLPDDIAAGHDAIAFMQDTVSTAYNKITPNLTLTPDKRLAVGFRNAQNIIGQLPDQQRDQFNRIVAAKLTFGQGGPMAGRRLAVAVRDIRDQAAGYGKSALESERQLGQALDAIDDALQSSLSAQNPGYAEALKRANLAYRGTRIMSDAAKGADEGIASTGQIKSAVRMNDRTKNQRATAAGRAHMQDYSRAGRKVLPAKTPDSGTAGRANEGSWIAQGRGLADEQLYKLNKAMTQLRLAERPEILKRLGRRIQDGRAQAALIGGGMFGPFLGSE